MPFIFLFCARPFESAAPLGPPLYLGGAARTRGGGRAKQKRLPEGASLPPLPRAGDLRAERHQPRPAAPEVCGFAPRTARAGRPIRANFTSAASLLSLAEGYSILEFTVFEKTWCKKGWQSTGIVNLFECTKYQMRRHRTNVLSPPRAWQRLSLCFRQKNFTA